METLETLPAIIGSTRAMIGETPYRIGPSAIAAAHESLWQGLARQSRQRTGLPHRPRSAPARPVQCRLDARLCRRLRLRRARRRSRWAPRRGPLGFIHHRAADRPQPYFDSLDGPAVYPAFHVMAGLARGPAVILSRPQSSEPRRVAALAWREGDARVLWLANLTAEPLTIRIAGLRGRATASDRSSTPPRSSRRRLVGCAGRAERVRSRRRSSPSTPMPWRASKSTTSKRL